MGLWQTIKELFGLDHDPQGRWYVYALRDPRFDPPRVFYVGKGTNDRMYQHEKDMRRLLKQGRGGIMRLQPKHKRILEIIDDGREIVYEVVFRTDSEENAYKVENEVIEDIGLEHLTNEQYGHKPKNRTNLRKKGRAA